MPVDRQLEFTDVALDVLHSFWVPSGGSSATWSRPRTRRRRRSTTSRRHPGPARAPSAHLHRALRHRARDDAGAGGGRVPGGVRRLARRAGEGAGRSAARRPRRASQAGRRLTEVDARVAAALKTPGLTRAGLGFLIGGGLRLRPRRRAARDLRARDLPDRADRLPAPDRARRSPPRSASWSGSAASTTGSAGPSARRPCPTTTPSTARQSWRDYFKFNTDHKVIGIQYIVTTFFFFLVGGLIAMLIRAELAQPGTQIVDPSVFNGLFSTHAALMIFVFVIPVFAGIANYVLPLMIGAPDMAFPRLNALSFWMLPMAGLLFLASFLVPGGAFDAGWTGYAPLSTGAPLGPVVLQPRRAVRRRLVDRDRAQLPGHDHHHACARNDLLAHAAAGLGEPLDLAAGRRRDAVHRRRPVHGPLRPRPAHQLLPGGVRRRRAQLPAHLLVLLAPGRLHHDAARLRDRLRGDLDPRPQADLRLPADGAGADRDRRPLLHGLGAPHVRLRHVQLAAGADDDHDPADRGPDRDQDLLLAGDAVRLEVCT